MSSGTSDSFQRAAEIKQKARSLGFDLCGITDARPSRYGDFLREWLAAGRAGQMAYLHRRLDERLDPGQFLPGARSVVCVALNYHVPLQPSPYDRPGKVARYALGKDYHLHLKDRLFDLADWLRDRWPGAQTKVGTDTVPQLERELASRAGIGWVGKNTIVLNERIGSWLLLGEVLTTLELPADEPAIDRCGTCRRCIDACPTGAIDQPYQLNASRCISYLTIEHQGEIDPQLEKKMSGWVAGCDICQEVCPWNGRAPVAMLEDLRPRHASGTLDADAIESWTDEQYWQATRHQATRRIKLEQFKRNARCVPRAKPAAES